MTSVSLQKREHMWLLREEVLHPQHFSEFFGIFVGPPRALLVENGVVTVTILLSTLSRTICQSETITTKTAHLGEQISQTLNVVLLTLYAL